MWPPATRAFLLCRCAVSKAEHHYNSGAFGMTSPRFPEPPAAVAATSLAEVDAAVERVASKKQVWVQTGIAERIALLRQCQAGVAREASAWVRDVCAVKGLSPDDNLAGEEWLAGPGTTA